MAKKLQEAGANSASLSFIVGFGTYTLFARSRQKLNYIVYGHDSGNLGGRDSDRAVSACQRFGRVARSVGQEFLEAVMWGIAYAAFEVASDRLDKVLKRR